MDLHEPESRTQVMSNDGDDGYIDFEVNLSSSSSSSSPSSSFFSFAVTSSPPQSREFEFQMCSSVVASGVSTTSPADDLFYKGQLLPLHLPPRLQMVQKLLLASSSSSAATETPISPRASASSPRRFSSSEIVVSGQDEQRFFDISTELKRFSENKENYPGNSSNKKIKQSSITQKLKASRAYIRALFSKPGSSDSSEIHPKCKTEPTKISTKNPQYLNHRRSFSGVIQKHYPAKCSSSSSSSSSASSLSSSFSFGSNGSLDLQTLMRSSNASDNSIAGAIEHCKQSLTTRKSNVAESELSSSSRTSVSTSGDLENG